MQFRMVIISVAVFGSLMVLGCRHQEESSDSKKKASGKNSLPTESPLDIEFSMAALGEILSSSVSPISAQIDDESTKTSLPLLNKNKGGNKDPQAGSNSNSEATNTAENNRETIELMNAFGAEREKINLLIRSIPRTADGFETYFNNKKRENIPTFSAELPDKSARILQVRLNNSSWIIAKIAGNKIDLRLMVNYSAPEYDQRQKDFIEAVESKAKAQEILDFITSESQKFVDQTSLEGLEQTLALREALYSQLDPYKGDINRADRIIAKELLWREILERPFSLIAVDGQTFLVRVLKDGDEARVEKLANDFIAALRSNAPIKDIWIKFDMDAVSKSALNFLFNDFRTIEGKSFWKFIKNDSKISKSRKSEIQSNIKNKRDLIID